MLRFIAGLLGRRPSSNEDRPSGARPESERTPERPEPPLPDSVDPGFAPFARVLGIVPAAPPPLSPEEEEEDLRIAALVLEHFQKNRPGPASAPSLSLQILNLVASPRTGPADLARLVQNDPALAASLLHVANSAYHRGVDEVESVRDAVTRIGLEEAGRVAGALAAKSLFSPRMRQEFAVYSARWSDLFTRAVTVATVSASLAMRKPPARSDRAYLGGMLLDVGKSVALRSLSALRVDQAAAPSDGRIDRILERLHLEIGGDVHQEWNLPQYLTVLCVRHHDDSVPAGAEFADLHVVRFVSALEDLRRSPDRTPHAQVELAQSAEVLGLDPLATRALLAELRTTADRVARTFSLDRSPRPAP
ncbi:MAG TPA: HDOD domain-containing protein [Anaeromyxobacteraceae bacterium]|nr:HDOD domain-containing protein [Anaeromyxobacteraceae bacterium]